jgi:hypothetical protein
MTTSTRASSRPLDTAALAGLFGLGESAIRERIGLGRFGPVVKIGKRYFLREETFKALFRRRELEAARRLRPSTRGRRVWNLELSDGETSVQR